MDYNIEGADIHSLLSNALEKMVHRALGASRQYSSVSKQRSSIVEIISRIESSIQPLVEPRETALRVGSLELDLIERTAKRGKRPIDLRPREFRLLKYMMERSGQLVTRATLQECMALQIRS
jgi:DNA-binding response OmpR family regulator